MTGRKVFAFWIILFHFYFLIYCRASHPTSYQFPPRSAPRAVKTHGADHVCLRKMQGACVAAPHVRKLRHVPRPGGGGCAGKIDKEGTEVERTRARNAGSCDKITRFWRANPERKRRGERKATAGNGSAVERGGAIKKVNQEVATKPKVLVLSDGASATEAGIRNIRSVRRSKIQNFSSTNS